MEASPLYLALVQRMKTNQIADSALCKALKGPQRLGTNRYDALYWVHPTNLNAPAVVKFFGLLDLHGNDSKSGPYFNNAGQSTVYSFSLLLDHLLTTLL